MATAKLTFSSPASGRPSFYGASLPATSSPSNCAAMAQAPAASSSHGDCGAANSHRPCCGFWVWEEHVFGGAASPPKGGNPDSNTLISDTTTVICLDRTGRKVEKVTALDPRANNFDLMYEQVKAIKEGKPIEKPIYNHVTGLLDPPETIQPPKIFVIDE